MGSGSRTRSRACETASQSGCSATSCSGPAWRHASGKPTGSWSLWSRPLVVLAAVVVMLPGAGRRSQLLALALVVTAVVVFAIPAWGRGTTSLALFEGGLDQSGAPRFSVAPVLLLGSALAVLVSPVGVVIGLRRRVGFALLASVLMLLMAVDFRGREPALDDGAVEHSGGSRGEVVSVRARRPSCDDPQLRGSGPTGSAPMQRRQVARPVVHPMAGSVGHAERSLFACQGGRRGCLGGRVGVAWSDDGSGRCV